MNRGLFAVSVLSPAVGLALAAYAQQMQSQMVPMKGEMKDEVAMPTTTGSLKVVSPANGARITTTDIPARVAVSNFRVGRGCQPAGRSERRAYPRHGRRHDDGEAVQFLHHP